MKKQIKEIIISYGPSILSGAALIFCFPKFDFYWLAWIALVPFLASLPGKKAAEAFRSGLLMGIIYFFGTLYWIYNSINQYGGISFIPSLALVLLMSVYLGLYIGLFAVLFTKKICSTRFPALFLAPVFWVPIEYLRAYAVTGFPWSSIGYTQYTFLHAIQVADITGIYGVSFLVVAVNGALADFFIIKQRLRSMPLFSLSQTAIGLFSLSVILAFVFLYGSYRLNQPRTGNPINISIVQGNIAQDRKWDAAYQREVLDTYKQLSLAANETVSPPKLIVWPEAALPFYFGSDPVLTEELTGFQQELKTYLLFGSVLRHEPLSKSETKQTLTNSVVLLDTDGKSTFIYDKIHLVPFGEYVPLKNILFFINRLTSGIGDYVPGAHTLKATTPFGSFGVHICYEIIFPGLVRKFYSKGGDFLVTITNDAWFGDTAGPYQHFSMAVFRAIENRKPVVRAANTGISGFIDSTGKILMSSSLFKKEILSRTIFADRTKTFYSTYGDLFSYLCIVMSIFILLNVSRRR